MKSFIITFILLNSCTRPFPEQGVYVTPELRPYVKAFTFQAGKVGKNVQVTNLAVRFNSSLPAETLGQCLDVPKAPLILINAVDWNDQTEVHKTVVMFHELGHCVLDRPHIETWTNGIMTSIMFPYIMADNIYADNWNYYMHELFYGEE